MREGETGGGGISFSHRFHRKIYRDQRSRRGPRLLKTKKRRRRTKGMLTNRTINRGGRGKSGDKVVAWLACATQTEEPMIDYDKEEWPGKAKAKMHLWGG